MKIKEIGHIAFTCKDLDASIAFYTQILGLEEVFHLTYEDGGTKREGDPRWIVYLKVNDGNYIELFNGQDATEEEIADGNKFNYSHFCVIVEDLKSVREEIIAKGAPIDTDLQMGPDNSYQMWTHDPDGNRIEIMQYTDRSYQITGR